MEYVFLGSIILIMQFLVTHHINKRKRKRKIEQIRSAWSKPKTDAFPFESIGKYADAIKENNFHRLTDQTIEDIDFYQLFAFIDRTTSRVGQQFLFKKVVEPTSHIEHKSEGLITLFTKDKDLREKIQLILLKLSSNDAYYISSLVRDKLLERPTWFKFLTLDVVIVACLLILSFKFPVLLIVLIIPITLNMILHYWNKSNTFQFTRSIPQMNLLIAVSKELLKSGDVFYDKSVASSISDLRSFQRKAILIRFDNKGGMQAELSQLALYLIDLLKVFFLIEVIMLFKVLRELKTKQAAIINLFNYVGNVDASISIASLRAGTLKTCQPVLVSAQKELVVKNIYHPLIENCVENSLSISNRSVLITGSNMSGKSTFLRTLAINSILAQTIYTCFADEYISPIVKQFSSIRIDDNLFQGKSFYFQEVNIMASLIAEADLLHQNLFLLDEVFKGTNTVERIAAAKAILSYLNRKNNFVVVATHDIELADMLVGEYDLYHFTETIEDKELHFDHRIKSGQLRTRNAIKILELSNYPADIINEARYISTTLGTKRIGEE